MIHGLSPWKSGPFVKVNCPAIPGTLLESELFGYEKGAFTGAYGTKPGRVEMAHRGTLFLDEISELDLALQSKLLAVVAGRPVLPHRRAGRQESRSPHRLRHQPPAGSRNRERHLPSGFVLPHQRGQSAHAAIARAPRRYRRLWSNISSNIYNRKYNCRARTLSLDLMAVLQKYHWPGNIRELENLIKRYVILGSEEVISNDLVARSEQEFFNPDINLDGPISLKSSDPQGHPRTGAQDHSESSAGPSLEPQAGGTRAVHQLPRAALQDSRRRPAAQPLHPPPRSRSRRRHSRRLNPVARVVTDASPVHGAKKSASLCRHETRVQGKSMGFIHAAKPQFQV